MTLWYNKTVITCGICRQKFKVLTNTHLKSRHKISFSRYKKRFPKLKIGFTPPNLYPKKSQVFINWKKSLSKRGPSWCRGYTKETHPSVLKISKTMKRKKIDNFAKWRQKMIKLGRIRRYYPLFKKSNSLAFLIGLTLGDGNIYVFPRTQCLTIALNTKYPKLINYTEYLLRHFFEKDPSLNKIGNCIKVRVYQKYISERLYVQSGSRRNSKIGIPKWVWESQDYLIYCLKGLFEAEGSLSIHLPTYTYNFQFKNTNKKLLNDVGKALKILKFNPEFRKTSTRLRKKKEVEIFRNLIFFREYKYCGIV